MDEIYDKLKSIVSKKIKDIDLNPQDELTSLGLDSLDKAEIMINIEDEFGIEFDEEEMTDVKTIEDLHKLVAKKISN
ncbi:MAG: acyl carrier protein [Bacilli bacterium]